MRFEEIYERTKYAFEHDEVFELLTGQKEYLYQAPRYIASVPTCDEFVFRDGIYPLYSNSNEKERKDMISSIMAAMRKMMRSDDPVERWWALSICYGMKLNEAKYNEDTFYVADELLAEIAPFLLEKESELFNNEKYLGGNNPGGLWGDIQRYDILLERNFNISLFQFNDNVYTNDLEKMGNCYLGCLGGDHIIYEQKPVECGEVIKNFINVLDK